MDAISVTPSTRKQIRLLFVVLVAAICTGAGIVAALVYNYGMHRIYQVSQLLPPPDWFSSLSQETLSSKKQDRIVLMTSDPWTGQMRLYPLSLSEYRDLYNLTDSLKSFKTPPEEAVKSFSRGPSTVLILNVKQPLREKGPSFFSREVQFGQSDDFFRIDLSDSNQDANYAYFQSYKIHPYLRQQKVKINE